MSSDIDKPAVLISLIVPVYEAEAHIHACLVSVLDQLSVDCELILIDDGSPDDSMTIAKTLIDRYGEVGSRIRLISQDNQGLSGARNTGIKAACGRFVGFLDADDLLHPSYIARLRDVIQSEPSVSIVCFQAERLIETSSGTSHREHLPVHAGAAVFDPRSFDGYETLVDNFARGRWFAWARLYARELFETHLFTDGFKYQDMLLLPELYRRATRIVNIDDPLVAYRIHETSITARPNARTFADLDAIIAYYSAPSATLSPRLDTLRHLVVLDAIESVFHAARRTSSTRAARYAMRQRQKHMGAFWLAWVLARHARRMNSRSLVLHLSPTTFHAAGVVQRRLRDVLQSEGRFR